MESYCLITKRCEEKIILKLNYLSSYLVCQVIKCRYNEYYKICITSLEVPLIPSHIKALIHDKKGCRKKVLFWEKIVCL